MIYCDDNPTASQKLDFSSPPLSTLYLYLTKGCNLACQHCWVKPHYKADGTTGGHLQLDVFKRAIDEAIPLGLKTVKLTGGEPTLHPEFKEILTFLKQRKIRTLMETNGVLVDRGLAVFMKEESSLGFISVSIDGADAETHDAFRGVKGSFDKSMNCLKSLIDVGFRPEIIMSLHQGNVTQIENLVLAADAMGVATFKFNLINSSGRGASMIKRGKTFGIQEMLDIGSWVEGTLQKKVALRLHYSWPIAFQSIERLNASVGTCGIKNILGILSDGTMAMCGIGSQERDLSYGEIGEVSMREAWCENPMLKNLRDSVPKKLTGVCQRCILKDRCLGACVAENYHRNQSLFAPFWFCQQAFDAGVFPTSRLR